MRTGLSAQRITPLGGALLVLACLFGTTPSTYAGDGAATQAITGVGFSPEYVIIMGDGSHWAYNRTNQGTNQARRLRNGGPEIDIIPSLDGDGFTVGNGGGGSDDQNSSGTTYHFLFTMNCLNGYFHFPYHNSVSEELLKAEGKGIIAAFSPTGLSLNSPAHRFHKLLLDHMVHQEYGRLGDAILAGQVAYAQTGAFSERLNIYHLLGDPALRLR